MAYDKQDTLKKLKAEKLKRECRANLWKFIISTSPEVFDNGDRIRLFKGLADYITDFFKKNDISEKKDLDDLTKEEKEELINHVAVNLATFPRAGKSYFISHMVTWILGNYPETKIIVVSRTDDLASSFIRNMCNIMRSPMYRLIFDDIEIETENTTIIGVRRKGSGLKSVRSVYAVGIFGQITGFGANVMILDDIYKNHEEAFSETINKKIKSVYYSAIETRMEGVNRLEVHIGTRWSQNELFADFEAVGFYDKIIKTKALNEETQKSNYPSIHNTKKLLRVKNDNKIIFQSAYQQSAIDEKIRLFNKNELRVTNNFHSGSNNRFVIIDPADGGDFTTGGFFANQRDGSDVLEWVVYRRESIILTAERIIELIILLKPRVVFIETNNDKTLFYKLRDTFIKTNIMIKSFKSSSNKHIKIFNKSGDIKNRTLFNEKYKDKGTYKEFMDDLTRFHMDTKEHDDSADMLAMKEELTYKHREFLKDIMNYTYR